jgi:hypothetical protein
MSSISAESAKSMGRPFGCQLANNASIVTLSRGRE